MNYSIQADIKATHEQLIINLINTYKIWRLVPEVYKDENEIERFSFEVWLESEESKTEIYDIVKGIVEKDGGKVQWHICRHDEGINKCDLEETFVGDN